MPKLSSALIALMLLVGSAHAQSKPSNAARLEWPKTFSGQPDFAFTRDEAQGEAITNPSKVSVSTVQQGLPDLIADETKLDPLGLQQPLISAAEMVSGTEGVSTTVAAPSLMDKLLGDVVALPTYETSYTLDMAEFRGVLNHAISTTVANWRPDTSLYNVGDLTRTMLLQAVVTSPERYAVINGQRYQVGDSFLIRAPIAVPDLEIIAALQRYMPVSSTLPPAAMEQYQQAYEEVIATFATARTAQPSIGQQSLSVPVVVKEIQPRKVVLDVNGETHDLVVKFAY